MEALLGPKLLRGKEEVSTSEAVGDADVVLLQFSAHWCGPCKAFTPMLQQFIDSFNGKTEKPPVVVFISSDRSEDEFASYFGSMSWLALPYSDRDTKAKLSLKYKVQGIPTLVAVDAKTGETITTSAREKLMAEPDSFPWRPRPFADVAGETLVKCGSETGELNLKEHLAGKYVGVYFSAHWCPPCKMFTPMLASVYKALKANRDDFEFVFVSSDRDSASFATYTKEMPWTAIPFSNAQARQELSSMFDVEGIPTFAMLNNDAGHSLLSANARGSVMRDPKGEDFPWLPKPVMSLEEGAEFLNGAPCLVLLAEAAGASDVAAAKDALSVVAEEEKAQAGDDAIKFLVADTRDSMTQQIRGLCQMPEPKAGEKRAVCSGDVCRQVDGTTPQMILLNIPDEGAFYECEDVVSEASVREFIRSFKAGCVERKQLKK